MRKCNRKPLVSALLLGLTLAGAPISQAQEPVKVGFIYVGPVGDYGWSYQHDQARQFVEEKFAGKVQTTFVESVKEGADTERVLSQLIGSGHQLIFSTSFGFMNGTLKVAKKNPQVRFEHATGYKQAENVAIYSGRFYEGRYLTGMLAASVSKTQTIGYVGSYPIPEVIRGINAMALGAQSVNPNIKINVVWTNSWYDPGKESEAAKALVNAGADVLAQHLDSPAVVQAAEESGVWSIGAVTDMSKFAPKKHLTSIVYNWRDYYQSRVQAALDGSWKTANTWDGFDQNVLSLTTINVTVPAEVVSKVEQSKQGLIEHRLHPFTGPLSSNEGKVVLADGAVMNDEDLLKMNYFVKGVQGDLPK